MTIKAGITKAWFIKKSADGRAWSAWKNGNKAAPLITHISWSAGPRAAPGVGENDLGCFLFIYGWRLGSFSEYGNTLKLTIGDVEVDNYRHLTPCVGPVGSKLGLQCLAVQVGALTGLTNGTAYPIDIKSGSTSVLGNTLTSGVFYDLDDRPLTFTPNPGNIVFVSLTGNNANSGTFASPLRNLQTYNGTSQFGGALFGPVSGRTTSNQVKPGTHIYIRAGDYGADKSFNNRWADFFRITGVAPTGAANTGPICISSYPGLAGSNSPELAQWLGISGTDGGFNLADTARSSESTPWGTTGFCKWLCFANLQIRSHPSSASDAAPINRQTASDFCRVSNCELEWRCNVGSPTAAGIAGEGSDYFLTGNYIHDIYDPSGNLQNHGIYIGNNTGASGAAQADYRGVVAYNYIFNCTGGQSIMARGTTGTSPADAAPYLSVHHNWCEGHGKYGMQFFDDRKFVRVWTNIVIAGANGLAGISHNTDNISAINGLYFGFNTIVGWKTYAGFYFQGAGGPGNSRIEGNVVYQTSNNNSVYDFYQNNNGSLTSFGGNLYFDQDGGISVKPAEDSTGIYANPLFVNAALGDYSPASNSPMLNAGITPATVTTIKPIDFFGNARPQGAASKWAFGAIERVGT